MKEICEEMGVCEKVVRRWVACGAPIAVEGEGTKARYSAELMRLQLWREVFGKDRLGMTRHLFCVQPQSRAHGVRRFFNDSEVRADGRIRSTFSLFPIPQHGY